MDSLPVEIRHMILSQLDPFSFQNAISSNRAWRKAAHDIVVLRQHLSELPLAQEARAGIRRHDLSSLISAQQRAASTLLLRAHIQTHTHRNPYGMLESKVAFSKDKLRAVTLEDRVLTLYSIYDQHDRSDIQVLARRRLNDIRSPTKDGPVLRNAPSCVFELALADDSAMVAVALDRSVQIYDMENEEEPPLSAYVAAAGGSFIAGLDFECQDAALRLELSKKGTVLFLGAINGPKTESSTNFAEWKKHAALHSIMLDSTSIRVVDSVDATLASPIGMRLLDRAGQGWRFVAQKSTTTAYCIGWISDDAVLQSARDPRGVEAGLVLDLPCSDSGMACEHTTYWAKHPAGGAQAYPRYYFSPDRRLVVVTEETDDMKTRVFVWKLPVFEDLNVDPKGNEQPWPNRDAELMVKRVALYVGELEGRVLAGSCQQSLLNGRSYRICLTSRTGVVEFCIHLLAGCGARGPEGWRWSAKARARPTTSADDGRAIPHVH